MRDDAFISYSHAADGKLATRLHSALHRFAKPWYRLRMVRVFRDETSLSATPELWSTIEKALNQSAYFILLASPQASESRWVQREVDHWLQGRSAQSLLIAVTDGEILWDTDKNDFDWARTNAIPHNLAAAYPQEPFYLDLRRCKTPADLSQRHPDFRAAVAALTATLRGADKDKLIGEDIRLHRQALRLAWLAGISLTVLLCVSLVMTERALDKEEEAERERNLALTRQLAAEARLLLENPSAAALTRGALLAAESLRRRPSLSAYVAWHKAMQLLPTLPERIDSARIDLETRLFSFSGGGDHLALNVLEKAEQDQSTENLSRVEREPSGGLLRLHRPGSVRTVVSLDGRTLAQYDQETTTIWDLSNDRPMSTIPARPQSVVALSADGQRLAVWHRSQIEIWDVETGGMVEQASLGWEISPDLVTTANAEANTERNSVLAVSADGCRLALTQGRVVHVRDVCANTNPVELELPSDVLSLVFSPEGERLVIGVYFSGAMVLDVGSGTVIARVSQEESTHEVVTSPNTRYVVTIDRMAHARVAEAQSDRELLLVRNTGVGDVAFSGDSRYLAMLWDDQAARVWELPSMREVVRIPSGEDPIWVSVASGGQAVAVATTERSVQVWDLPQPQHLRFETPEGWRPDLLELDQLVVATSEGAALQYGDPSPTSGYFNQSGHKFADISPLDEKPYPPRPNTRHPERRFIRFSDDNAFVAAIDCSDRDSSADSGVLSIWRTQDSSRIGELSSNVCPWSVAFSANHRWLALGYLSSSNPLQLWDVSRGSLINLQIDGDLTALGPDIEDVAFSSDSRSLAAAAKSETILWRIRNDSVHKVLSLPHTPASAVDWRTARESVVLSPDGQYLARGTRGNVVALWETETGQQLATIYHDNVVADLAFSPDGRWLASASHDHTARILSVPRGETIARFEHPDLVEQVAFTPDGKYLITGSWTKNWDFVARLWPWRAGELIAGLCARLPRNLTKDEWGFYFGGEPYRPTCPARPSPPLEPTSAQTEHP